MPLKLLVVDVGNTSTAVGLWSDGRVSNVRHCDGGFAEAAKMAEAILALPREGARVTKVGSCRSGTLSNRNPSALASENRNPSALASEKGECAGLAYVSVVPKQDAKWRRWAKAKGLRIHQVSHRDFDCTGTGPGVRVSHAHYGTGLPRISYPHPETIGADRLCDAAAAVDRYGAPVLVMDFGTALTAAIVTRDRVWRGGVIAPGFPLMRDYLFERTAKLPRMTMGTGRAPKIGRSTGEAMRFGALVGYRGMVREIVATLKANFREDFKLVATGGFAKWVLRDLDLDFTIDPTLTLHGAGVIGDSSIIVTRAPSRGRTGK